MQKFRYLLCVGTVFLCIAVFQALPSAPVLFDGAGGRKLLLLDGIVEHFRFFTEVTVQPVIADSVDGDDVNGFSNATLCRCAEIAVPA